tara:strand:+ start:348 stop:536 length:189 start_codon:yes stop_codon:yes gene_type:complete
MSDKDKNLEQAIKELKEANEILVEINKNLTALVMFHQMQLASLVEAYPMAEDEVIIEKKIIH